MNVYCACLPRYKLGLCFIDNVRQEIEQLRFIDSIYLKELRNTQCYLHQIWYTIVD